MARRCSPSWPPTRPARFTVGIVDDVTHLSLPAGRRLRPPPARRRALRGVLRAGLRRHRRRQQEHRQDHRRGHRPHVQAYFVYDSKKSGATTVSHLRFSPSRSAPPYLVEAADVVACHQFGLLEKLDVLVVAARAARCCSTRRSARRGLRPAARRRPAAARRTRPALFVIDGHATARDAGLGGRISTVMQVAFFVASGLLPSGRGARGHRGRGASRPTPPTARWSSSATSRRSARPPTPCTRSRCPATVTSTLASARVPSTVRWSCAGHPETSPSSVERVTARIIDGEGELLPSPRCPSTARSRPARPLGEALAGRRRSRSGTRTCASTAASARSSAPTPRSRSRCSKPDALDGAPDGVPVQAVQGPRPHRPPADRAGRPRRLHRVRGLRRGLPGGVQGGVGHQAIDMEPADEHRDAERDNFRFFESIPYPTAPRPPRHGQAHPDAAAAVRVLRRLRGLRRDPLPQADDPAVRRPDRGRQRHRLLVDLRRQPAHHPVGHRTPPGAVPAWSNSLFEDNAEFGLGSGWASTSSGSDRRAPARSCSPATSATTWSTGCSPDLAPVTRRASPISASGSPSCAAGSASIDGELGARAAARGGRRGAGPPRRLDRRR
jgi:pyruvate-ferredoxin/flavodoxin oxidoreductase